MSEPSSELQIRKPESVVARTLPRTRLVGPEEHHSSFGRADILYALFKHKKKIIAATLVGLGAAAVAYFLYPPVYESEAKLLVRYVVERSTVDPLDPATSSSGLTGSGQNVLGSEVQILTSWDLAVQTADAIGPKRLFPGSKTVPSKEAAARTIASGLSVTIAQGSNILFVSYRNKDPELATLVLSELVNRYFNKHLEVHRSAGAFDFVSQQTDQLRSRLNQTEDALKELKAKAGIISLADSMTALSGELVRTEGQLYAAEVEVAEQTARVRRLSGAIVEVNPKEPGAPATEAKPGPSSSPPEEIPSDVIEQYQSLVSRLPQLRQLRMDLLSKYTPESQQVRAKQAEINQAEKQRRSLEAQYPDLPSKVGPVSSSKFQQLDPASESAHLAGLQAKKDALTKRLNQVETQIHQLSQLSPQIADLDRQKELEETNYKYFQGTLEKARVDEALDPSKIPNISAVQRPSPPILMTKARDKLVLALAAGGLALGLAFALLNELVLSRTVRRSPQVEGTVGVAPLISIPYSSKIRIPSVSRTNGQGKALATNGAAQKNLAPWDPEHFVRPYCEAIRDRIGLFFELHKLTHKPKLVGVAGFSEAAGTSTLAAGLAAALSETNDGKVLLVDANLGPDQVHPFFRGRPAYALTAALQPNGPIDSVAENLYLATVGSGNAGPAQLGLKKFFELMPNLKASDFDYIIFDMPHLSETSPAWGMAAFMDKVLLVVEAEKDNRDVLKRGYRRLVNERDNVSLVFNKARSYGLKWAELES